MISLFHSRSSRQGWKWKDPTIAYFTDLHKKCTTARISPSKQKRSVQKRMTAPIIRGSWRHSTSNRHNMSKGSTNCHICSGRRGTSVRDNAQCATPCAVIHRGEEIRSVCSQLSSRPNLPVEGFHVIFLPIGKGGQRGHPNLGCHISP